MPPALPQRHPWRPSRRIVRPRARSTAMPLGQRGFQRVAQPGIGRTSSGQPVDHWIHAVGALGLRRRQDGRRLVGEVHDAVAGHDAHGSRLPGGPLPGGLGRPRLARRRETPPCSVCLARAGRACRPRFAACRGGLRGCSGGRIRGRSWRTEAADSRLPRWPCPRSSGSIAWHSCRSRRWQAECRRCGRRRAAPTAEETAVYRPKNSRCIAAALRRTGCPGQGSFCRCRSGRRRRSTSGGGCPDRSPAGC